MNRQHQAESGIQQFFLDLWDRSILRERAFGQIYAYVNPWCAAMDDEIESDRLRTLQSAARNRAERASRPRAARPEGSVVRL